MPRRRREIKSFAENVAKHSFDASSFPSWSFIYSWICTSEHSFSNFFLKLPNFLSMSSSGGTPFVFLSSASPWSTRLAQRRFFRWSLSLRIASWHTSRTPRVFPAKKTLSRFRARFSGWLESSVVLNIRKWRWWRMTSTSLDKLETVFSQPTPCLKCFWTWKKKITRNDTLCCKKLLLYFLVRCCTFYRLPPGGRVKLVGAERSRDAARSRRRQRYDITVSSRGSSTTPPSGASTSSFTRVLRLRSRLLSGCVKNHRWLTENGLRGDLAAWFASTAVGRRSVQRRGPQVQRRWKCVAITTTTTASTHWLHILHRRRRTKIMTWKASAWMHASTSWMARMWGKDRRRKSQPGFSVVACDVPLNAPSDHPRLPAYPLSSWSILYFFNQTVRSRWF